MRKKLVVANWKMNPAKGGDAKKLFLSVGAVATKLKTVETVVCPPLIYLQSFADLVKSRSFVLGAQDVFWEHAGAYTGNVSADMIFNAKARYVIVGHSERRALGEDDAMVNKKLKSILQFPLIPILCVGETKRDEDMKYVRALKDQVKKSLAGLSREEVRRVVIAYEPVWAIGRHALRACRPDECREAVHIIRQVLADILGETKHARDSMILYGGSVDSKNTREFLTDGLVDGLLVGRASLDAKEFTQLLKITESLS